MSVAQPRIAAQPARAGPVIGFVERERSGCEIGPCIGLPFAVPVLHMALNGEEREPVRLSFGSAKAVHSGRNSAGEATFVIALSMSAAATLFGGDAAAALGRFLPVEDGFWSALQDKLCEATSFAERVEIADQALASRINSAGLTTSRTLKAADAIAEDRWTGSVATLANAFGVEERTLRNRFRQEVGWSPKTLLRVARFNRALRALHPRSWAGKPKGDVRLEFADQAHFHRDFISLAGISPRAFTRAKQLSGDAMLHNVSVESLGCEFGG